MAFTITITGSPASGHSEQDIIRALTDFTASLQAPPAPLALLSASTFAGDQTGTTLDMGLLPDSES